MNYCIVFSDQKVYSITFKIQIKPFLHQIKHVKGIFLSPIELEIVKNKTKN